MSEGTNGLQFLVEETIRGMPEVSRFAMEYKEPDPESEPEKSHDTSPQPQGETFNPEIHATDPFGNPKRNKDGSYRKKRGRKPGQTSATKPDPETVKAKQTAQQAGQATAQAIFLAAQAIGGEEWSPIVNKQHGINEPEMMTSAWTQYYEATGTRDIPPWLGVVIACSSYGLIRMRLPQTQSRMKKLWSWIKSKTRKAQ